MTLATINFTGLALISISILVVAKHPSLKERNWFIASCLIGIVSFVLIFDPLLGGSWGGPTYSRWIADRATHYNSIPLFFGILGGHLFGERRKVSYSAWGFAIGPVIALFILDLYMNHFHDGAYPWWRYPLIYVALGLPIGMLFWGQGDDGSPIA